MLENTIILAAELVLCKVKGKDVPRRHTWGIEVWNRLLLAAALNGDQ